MLVGAFFTTVFSRMAITLTFHYATLEKKDEQEAFLTKYENISSHILDLAGDFGYTGFIGTIFPELLGNLLES